MAAVKGTVSSAFTRTLRVLTISGSLRAASTNSGLIRFAVENAPASMEIEEADISKFPVYNADLIDSDGNPPAEVAVVRKQIENADAIFMAVPEYNYSPAPPISNAIDWVPPSIWKGKCLAMVSSGGGMGGSRAQLQLRQKFVFLEGNVMLRPEVCISRFGPDKPFDEAGNLVSEKWQSRVLAQLKALEDYTRILIAGREAAAAAMKGKAEAEGRT